MKNYGNNKDFKKGENCKNANSGGGYEHFNVEDAKIYCDNVNSGDGLKSRKKRRELVYFRRINKLASVAVYLTTILLIYLFLSSFVSGAVSGSDTAKVMGMLVSVFGKDDDVKNDDNGQNAVKDDEPTSIVASLQKGDYKYRYNGDRAQIDVKVYPEGAKSCSLTFFSSNPEVAAVSEDGIVTLLKKGDAKIKVSVDKNSKIYSEFSVKSYGKNPITENVTVKLSESDVKVGEKSGFIINDGETLQGAARFSSLDESRVDIVGDVAYFIKEGMATVRATFENGKTSDFNFYVSNNPDLVKISRFSVEDGRFLSGEKIHVIDLIKDYTPTGADFDFKITSDNPAVAAVENGFVVMNDRGTANLTFAPFFDRDLAKTVQIEVWKITPESLKINCQNQLIVNGTMQLSAESAPVDYPDDIEWQVVSGFGKIVDGNKLKAEFFGKIKVRCQSVLNPDLTDEIVIDVILYSDFYSFVRKILGHFSMFALLGLGIWGSAFLLTNPTYSVIISVGVSFICAALCEMFQACTPGRYFAISDVFVNFTGTLTGMTVGIFAVVLYCLIKRIISKESYKKVKEAYSWVTVYTVFCKHKKSKTTKENNL